ncbi:MAG: hypothetical protein K6F96_06275 [Bacteroidales bacterium]|nr:hypothetical protein [Bacteroidales bacterium]
MTALVSILNKKAAVLAADSAVTVTNGEMTKIFNTETKLFRLSNHHPVGVMFYGNTEYMGMPWGVLIKLYRDKRKDKSFDSIKEYANDFLGFLKAEKRCNKEDDQMRHFVNEMTQVYDKIQANLNNMVEEAEQTEDNASVDHDRIVAQCFKELLQKAKQVYSDSGSNPGFEDYSIKRLRSYGKERFDELVDLCKEDGMPGVREEWGELFFDYFRSRVFYRETGLVFVGYGDEDLYPSVVTVCISGTFDDRLRYYFDEDDSDDITTTNSASIIPFAQCDTMLSLMRGIHPLMLDTVIQKYEDSLEISKEKILEAAEAAGVTKSQLAKLTDAVNMEEAVEKYRQELVGYYRNTFIDGVVDAVESFNVEDMVDMAESFISITNLQRHISSSEESVGGPVDVAVITKSEGFVWVKHKQWFQREMNPQMIERR